MACSLLPAGMIAYVIRGSQCPDQQLPSQLECLQTVFAMLKKESEYVHTHGLQQWK